VAVEPHNEVEWGVFACRQTQQVGVDGVGTDV